MEIPTTSIMNTQSKAWRRKRSEWLSLGLQDSEGREDTLAHYFCPTFDNKYVSLFDPVVAECAYRWFAPPKGRIFDPFCGGATRGFVAASLGMEYTGIDIRQEQISANIAQCGKLSPTPTYICADADYALDSIHDMYDMVFTCPPYYNLEVYSDLDGDLSNIETYEEFLIKYGSIIKKACRHLRIGGFAVFIVGDIRDKKGYYRGFIGDTISLFRSAGLGLWNECIIVQPSDNAYMRASLFPANKKVVKMHQNMLVFAKGIEKVETVTRQMQRMAKTTGRDWHDLFDEYSRMM